MSDRIWYLATSGKQEGPFLAGEIVEKIRAGDEGGMLQFAEDAAIDPVHLVNLVADGAGAYRMDGPFKLRFKWSPQPGRDSTDALDTLLKRLGAHGES